MSHSPAPTPISLLQECLAMALDPALHAEADRRFLELTAGLSAHPAVAEVVEVLWKEVLAARRSAAFWEQLSTVEKAMSDRLVDSNVQLQQNYLRLVQEQ